MIIYKIFQVRSIKNDFIKTVYIHTLRTLYLQYITILYVCVCVHILYISLKL